MLASEVPNDATRQLSYALGYGIGQKLRPYDIFVSMLTVERAFSDFALGHPPRYGDAERSSVVQQVDKLQKTLSGAELERANSADLQEKFSYSIAIELAQQLRPIRESLDFNTLLPAMRDGFDNRPSLLPSDRAQAILQKMRADLDERRMQAAAKNGAESFEFLERNGHRAGVVTTASGLQYEVVTRGHGDHPKVTDSVTVLYAGSLASGEVFDGAHRSTPVTIPLGKVIHGFTEGMQLMAVGETCRLFVPPALAYADRGAGTKIGPNQVLVFEITLLGIRSP